MSSVIDVSEVLSASIFRVEVSTISPCIHVLLYHSPNYLHPSDGHKIYLRNIGNTAEINMVL
jgi:hypothetical protein